MYVPCIESKVHSASELVMNVSIDIESNFHHGSITLSIIPMKKIVEFHVECTKVLPASLVN